MATSSIATELIIGNPVDYAATLTNRAVVEALEGLPPEKIHCSVLAEQVIKAVLRDYYRKIGVDYVPIVGEDLEDDDIHA